MLLLYSHKYINHNSNTIQIHRSTLVISDTNGFINFWLWSMVTQGETQFLKAYTSHTMLTPPQRVVPLVMIKISIHLCQSRSEKFNRNLNGRKLYWLQWSNTQLTSFQNPQILRIISSGHDVIHTPAPFPVWGFIMSNGDCHTLCMQA